MCLFLCCATADEKKALPKKLMQAVLEFYETEKTYIRGLKVYLPINSEFLPSCSRIASKMFAFALVCSRTCCMLSVYLLWTCVSCFPTICYLELLTRLLSWQCLGLYVFSFI